MNTTKQMAKVITEIAAAHGFDLTNPDHSLVLENAPYTRLVIGVEGPNLISVAHRAIPDPGEDALSDPDMLFYTGYGEAWVPVEITMITGYYQQATMLKDGAPCGYYPRAQREQAQFANMWARNLRAQGWTKHATRETQPVAA